MMTLDEFCQKRCFPSMRFDDRNACADDDAYDKAVADFFEKYCRDCPIQRIKEMAGV